MTLWATTLSTVLGETTPQNNSGGIDHPNAHNELHAFYNIFKAGIIDPSLITTDYGFQGIDGTSPTAANLGSIKGVRQSVIIDGSAVAYNSTPTHGVVGFTSDLWIKSTAPADNSSYDALRSSLLVQQQACEPYSMYAHSVIDVNPTGGGFGGAGVNSDVYSNVANDNVDAKWRGFMADSYGPYHPGAGFHVHNAPGGGDSWRVGLWVQDSWDMGARFHYDIDDPTRQWIGLHTISPETAGVQWGGAFSRRYVADGDSNGILFAEYGAGAAGYAVGGDVGLLDLTVHHGGAVRLQRVSANERAVIISAMSGGNQGSSNDVVSIEGYGSVKMHKNGQFVPLLTLTSIATAGPETLTAAQIYTGLIERDANGAPRTDTTDTALNLIAGLGLTIAGQCHTVIYTNIGAYTLTLAGGAGVTFGTTPLTVPAGTTVQLVICRFTATAVKIYVIGNG